MKLKLLINGAEGKMGQVASVAVAKDPRLTVVGQTDRHDNLAQSIADTKAQIVVDFTEPAAAYQNTLTIIRAGAHPVIGTTGFTESQIAQLQELCRKLQRGGIIAPNFSLGMAMIIKYSQELIKYFPHVNIIEMHNIYKKDSPSGTSLYTAVKLRDALSHGAAESEREECNIPIHSVRLPGILSQQQIIFGSTYETITLTHDSIDRQSFMPGVCLACVKVLELNELVYGLENIL